MLGAPAIAARRLLNIVPGRLIAAEVMITREADRRVAAIEPLVGTTDIPPVFGVTKQHASAITTRGDFPAPAAKLAPGVAAGGC
jgi:hypothetical protein